MNRRRWMALGFVLGSLCFLVGPFPGYANLVGDAADAVTFFVGSILFTAGGALQSGLAWPGRHQPGAGRSAWWAAIIQSAGTLFFNVTTYQAMHTAVTSSEYNKLVWRPDWRGSICFLVSGAIAYRASPRNAWLPTGEGAGWWQPAVNLLGCIFFGISAIAGYVVPRPARCSPRPHATGTPRWVPRASWPARSILCTPASPRRCRDFSGSARSNTSSSATSRGRSKACNSVQRHVVAGPGFG